MKRIAQVGTFNVDNLGDLLFPVVFEKLIKEVCNEEYQIVIFSPSNYDYNPTYSDQIVVHDLTEFDSYLFDHVFIGGGDLLRSDDWSINRLYNSNQLSFSWIMSPTIKLIDNCYTLGLGVPFKLDEGFSEYIKNSFYRFRRISVRDDLSRNLLEYSGIDSEIVPDIVVSISKFFPKDSLQSNLHSAFTRNNISIEPGQYFVFQANDTVLQADEINKMAIFLNDLSISLNIPVILLSIGECLGDNDLFDKLAPLLKNCFVVDKAKDSLLTLIDKVSIIANAKGFLGSSLHGNIISYSYNVPFVTFTGDYSTKLTGFFNLTNNQKYCLKNPSVIFNEENPYIVEYFSRRTTNKEDVEKHTKIIVDFIKDALLDQSNNNQLQKYSENLDYLFKIEQTVITLKNREVSELWERVNTCEERSSHLENINSELWDRVAISERKQDELLDQNSSLWKRVNESEDYLETQKKQIEELWERVNKAELSNDYIKNDLQKAIEEIQHHNLIIESLNNENKQLREIKEEYVKSFYYRVKNKLTGKGN